MIQISTDLSRPFFSHRLQQIDVRTDEEYIDVQLYVNDTTILKERYFVYNNWVRIPNINEPVEEHMSGNPDWVIAKCAIRIGGVHDSVSSEFTVIYCDKYIGVGNEGTWLEEHFLSLAENVRIKHGGSIRLAWLAKAGDSLDVKLLTTFMRNGVLMTNERSYNTLGTASVDDIYFVNVNTDEIIDHDGTENIELISVTATTGRRSMTIYFDKELDSAERFFYLNVFNIIEFIEFNGTTVEKMSSESSMAIISKRKTKYDISHETEYETETAPLTDDEKIMAQQLITSNVIKKVDRYDDFDDAPAIIINDYTFECSNNRDELTKIKFSWQYSEMGARLEAKGDANVFDETYNPTYL